MIHRQMILEREQSLLANHTAQNILAHQEEFLRMSDAEARARAAAAAVSQASTSRP